MKTWQFMLHLVRYRPWLYSYQYTENNDSVF